MPKIIPSEVMTPATVEIISISVPPLILEIDDAFESEHIIGGRKIFCGQEVALFERYRSDILNVGSGCYPPCLLF